MLNVLIIELLSCAAIGSMVLISCYRHLSTASKLSPVIGSGHELRNVEPGTGDEIQRQTHVVSRRNSSITSHNVHAHEELGETEEEFSDVDMADDVQDDVEEVLVTLSS